jgi:Flp pilus assembly protein TadG
MLGKEEIRVRQLVSSNRKKHQRGQAMLETALVMTTLVGMLVFIMDMGRLLLIQQWVGERARATARAASVNNWNSTQAANYLVYNTTTAPNGGGAGYLGLLTSQVSYTFLGSSNSPDYRLQVKVSGVPVLTFIPYMANTYTLAPIIATMPAESLGATN